jgi:Protein of unknown function (DUF3305)
MGHAVTIQVGVILAKEPLDNPWEDHRWRAVGVILDAPLVDDWQEYGRAGDTILYHAVTLPLELHRKETPAYLANLESGEPAVWIVLRQDAGGTCRHPVEVHTVSASPHDVQAYGEQESESIQCVAMPAPLLALVEHHIDEPFVKRQRVRHHQPEEEKFGQQPIFQRAGGRRMTDRGSGNKDE